MHIAPYDNQNKPIVDAGDATVPLNYFNIVKLNPEVGREKMGQQLKYLKRRIDGERVWQFEPKAQHWMRLRVDEEAS